MAEPMVPKEAVAEILGQREQDEANNMLASGSIVHAAYEKKIRRTTVSLRIMDGTKTRSYLFRDITAVVIDKGELGRIVRSFLAEDEHGSS